MDRPSVYEAKDLDQALTLSQQFAGAVVLDLDGTLVAQGESLSESTRVQVSPESFDALRHHGVIILTNRRNAPNFFRGIPVLSSANKPWTARSILNDSGRIGCVIGDQLATDGVLAWRLGVPFIQVEPCSTRPWRAILGDRLMKRLSARWKQ